MNLGSAALVGSLAPAAKGAIQEAAAAFAASPVSKALAAMTGLASIADKKAVEESVMKIVGGVMESAGLGDEVRKLKIIDQIGAGLADLSKGNVSTLADRYRALLKLGGLGLVLRLGDVFLPGIGGAVERTRAGDIERERRRCKEELERQAQERAKEKERLVSDMLEVKDMLEIVCEAEAADKSDAGGVGVRKGMHMVAREMERVLRKNGVSEIVAANSVFDPAYHNAVQVIGSEGAGSESAGRCVGVVKKGYLLDGSVLRAANVRVSLQR